MFPVPGPISSTTSVLLTPALSTMAWTTRGFFRMCCPKDFLNSMPEKPPCEGAADRWSSETPPTASRRIVNHSHPACRRGRGAGGAQAASVSPRRTLSRPFFLLATPAALRSPGVDMMRPAQARQATLADAVPRGLSGQAAARLRVRAGASTCWPGPLGATPAMPGDAVEV